MLPAFGNQVTVLEMSYLLVLVNWVLHIFFSLDLTNTLGIRNMNKL